MTVRKTLSDEEKKVYDNNLVKRWRESNKDRIIAYNNKIKAVALTKTTCECGAVISSITINRHKRSKKHKLFISESEAQ